MTQFAVYPNPGRNADIPFVVQIQSTRLDRTFGRVVVPLVRLGAGSPPDHPLTPHLIVAGQVVHADPLDLVTLPARHLKVAVAVLAEADQDRIVRAMDEVASRA